MRRLWFVGRIRRRGKRSSRGDGGGLWRMGEVIAFRSGLDGLQIRYHSNVFVGDVPHRSGFMLDGFESRIEFS
jgi:hypothetical protein